MSSYIYFLGGGLPPQMAQDSQIDGIVEAVLGPAVEGIPNCYDSDRTTNTVSFSFDYYLIH